MPEPGITVWVEGEAANAKSAGGFTTKVTVAVWVRLPLVPVIVKVELPVGVVAAVVMVMVDDPELVTDDGLKLTVVPDGNPVALKLTVPLNPPDGVTVAV